MIINVDTKQQKKGIFKKIIILILFCLICFFIKENVFALSVPSFLTSFENNNRVRCNSSDGICLDDDIHTFKAFIEYYGMPTHPYVLSFDNSPGLYSTIYLFSEKPYFDCGPLYCQIYSSKSLQNHSNFIWLAQDGSISSDDNIYWNVYLSSTNPSTTNFTFFSSRLEEKFYSNFDIVDLDNNIIKPTTSNDTVDWNDTEDVPSPDNRNWFEKIIDSIVNTTNNIFNSVISIPSKIIDGIKSLFVPGDELEGFFEDEYAYIKEQLGFLTYPIEIVFDFANRFYELEDNDTAKLKIPKLEIFNHTIYEGTEFDLMSIVNGNKNFEYLYRIYRIIVSALIVFWLVNLAIKKEDEIFGSGGGLN